VRKTFKYRLSPTRSQAAILDRWLYACRRLYNAFLEQRQIAYRMGYRIGWVDQANELPQLKKELPEYQEIGAHVLQDVARRLERSFQNFFKGAGYPKFQGRNHYESFTFPDQSGWRLQGERLVLTGCGAVKVRWSRPIEGKIKTVTIRYRAGHWFVCFSCDGVPECPYPTSDAAVGIDLGIEALLTTSDGERFANPRRLRGKLKHLRRVSRHLARQKHKRSRRRKETIRHLQRLHQKIANQRVEAHHKASTALVMRYGVIKHEEIRPGFMLANRRMAQAAADVAWSKFLAILHWKAAKAQRTVIAVNPSGTSQRCSGCPAQVPKKLSQRWHTCTECGLQLHRDHNAARNILQAEG
jgi:putative transposase